MEKLNVELDALFHQHFGRDSIMSIATAARRMNQYHKEPSRETLFFVITAAADGVGFFRSKSP